MSLTVWPVNGKKGWIKNSQTEMVKRTSYHTGLFGSEIGNQTSNVVWSPTSANRRNLLRLI